MTEQAISYADWKAKKRNVPLNGVDYAVVDEGEGPPILLLHGFPDTSYLWRRQVPALVEAGFRVIAPDLRGFGGSSKPQDPRQYKLVTILGDLSALLRARGLERAHVVGHDWGAAVAWLFAALMPAKVDHLAVLSVGHPSVFHTPTLEQREKSWYMLLYQFAGVAEELLSRHHWKMFRDGIQDEGDIEEYIEELSAPGALTAALNWYRANRNPASELQPPPRLPLVAAPTLGVWSTGDRAMTEEAMLESSGFVKGPWRYERVEGASHWIPLSAPDAVNELLLGFLGTHETSHASRTRRKF